MLNSYYCLEKHIYILLLLLLLLLFFFFLLLFFFFVYFIYQDVDYIIAFQLSSRQTPVVAPVMV